MKQITLIAAGLAVALASSVALAKTEERIDIVTEGGIGKNWGAAPGASFVAPGYPAEMKERAANVCLSIGYSLDPKDGVPTDLILLQSWSRDKDDVALSDKELEPFVQAAAGALSQWRFQAKEGAQKHVHTFTAATMTFAGAEQTRPDNLPGQCRITDLPAYVEKESKNADRTNRGVLDRLARQHQQNMTNELNAAQRRRQQGR